MVSVNCAPPVGAFVAPTEPWCKSITAFTTASPSPYPPLGVRYAEVNKSFKLSSRIPGPGSRVTKNDDQVHTLHVTLNKEFVRGSRVSRNILEQVSDRFLNQ